MLDALGAAVPVLADWYSLYNLEISIVFKIGSSGDAHKDDSGATFFPEDSGGGLTELNWVKYFWTFSVVNSGMD